MKNPIQAPLRFIFTLIIICLLFVISCQQSDDGFINDEQVAMFSEQVLAIWNEGDMSLVEQIYTPDCVRHDCGLPVDIVGLDALKKHFESFRTAFPDLVMTVDDIIYQENKIVWLWTMKGTNTGQLQGLSSTNQAVFLSGVSLTSVLDGKINEVWDFYNQAAFLQQLKFTIVPPVVIEK